MKRNCIFFFLIFLSTNLLAQATDTEKIKKTIIDTAAISTWTCLGDNLTISNNGKYFDYDIKNQPFSNNTLVIQATGSSWKKECIGAVNVSFSKDSKTFVFMTSDTLSFLKLGTSNLWRIPKVISQKQPQADKGKWLAYQLKGDSMVLVLRNLLTGAERRYIHVKDYEFDNNANVLLLTIFSCQDKTTSLQWVNLADLNTKNIWTSFDSSHQDTKVVNYKLDYTGTQAAFIVQENRDEIKVNTIWYYKNGQPKAVIKATNFSPGISAGLSISNTLLNFSKDSRYIYFRLQSPWTSITEPGGTNVDIWSYKDTILQSTQLLTLKPITYTAVINTNSDYVVRLEREHEKIIATPITGDFVVTKIDTAGDRFWMGEFYGNSISPKWLVSLKDGSSKSIPTKGYSLFYFSPAGKYLIYYDLKAGSFYSCDLNTGKTVNISREIPADLLAEDNMFMHREPASIPKFPVGIAGWQENDEALFIYDNYDIWKLDPSGNGFPINITNGYGKLKNMKFRIVNETDIFYDAVVYKKNSILLLTAFNVNNKYNGFYYKQSNKSGNPQLLSMGPYTLFYYPGQVPGLDHSFDNGMAPLKAQDVNIWIVKRQTAADAPNYFLTKDFVNYKPLTTLQPQKAYNWLSAELVSWKQLDSIPTEGILYKPENFDPNKRYPVIFNYYQQMSGRLYQFPAPELMSANIDIAWFVSRGYLVFTPDIHYTFGRMGQSAYNSIVAAAQWLSRLSYVDSKHIGINGHSFAGFETNYIVTHTDLFAAALEGAGTSNWISSSLQLAGKAYSESSRLPSLENQIGKTLWDDPNLYIENSPVLKADKVTTPLIIFHSKSDDAVPWQQAVEMFIALRRLEKPAWMLQYDDGNHGVWGNDRIDFSIRVTQFFDHYLKNTPAPRWMTQGIPARLKGIDNGYELEYKN
ncbi:Prolyl oligopeptidase family protein [Chitinophaga rupis]|uniref:Prolyl oligopeptidase family protein n=1 Tax=Chitinophaga rupis TaxID=573321 RepID=A0A1H7RW28_9BACT|nr:prolyl oligopeptidase family serine peptidase [Chitinophaga rupis]SEL63617.1 Prolyl oligopeptidase family protein [Chitinophaga rupis]